MSRCVLPVCTRYLEMLLYRTTFIISTWEVTVVQVCVLCVLQKSCLQLEEFYHSWVFDPIKIWDGQDLVPALLSEVHGTRLEVFTLDFFHWIGVSCHSKQMGLNISGSGFIKHEMNRWFTVGSEVVLTICWTVVKKRELNRLKPSLT